MPIRILFHKHWEAIEAFKDNKPIQVAAADKEPLKWEDFLGENPDFTSSQWRWRIKPTPTLRPWRPEEVPVGICISVVDCKSAMQIVENMGVNGVNVVRFGKIERMSLVELKDFNYSLDYGKTWLPCGVVEE